MQAVTENVSALETCVAMCLCIFLRQQNMGILSNRFKKSPRENGWNTGGLFKKKSLKFKSASDGQPLQERRCCLQCAAVLHP